MIITSKLGKKNKIHLFLDGKYVATTTVDNWLSYNFQDGTDISNEKWNEILFDIQEKAIYNKALTLLELRDHSKYELSEKLYNKLSPSSSNKGSLKEQIRNICNGLENNGLLNDEHFASIYADELRRNKHLSPNGIRLALMKKGISRNIADDTIEKMHINSKEEILTLLNTKFKNRDLLVMNEQNKTFNALLRLGYSYNDIKSAIYEYTEYNN